MFLQLSFYVRELKFANVSPNPNPENRKRNYDKLSGTQEIREKATTGTD